VRFFTLMTNRYALNNDCWHEGAIMFWDKSESVRPNHALQRTGLRPVAELGCVCRSCPIARR
jgi:hypothetical protein